MDDEILVIVLTAILAGTIVITTIIRSIAGAVKHKTDAERAANGSSLTTSELERILRDVVTEATAPLQYQIEALEARLDSPRLEARSPKITVPDTEDEEAVPVIRARQRI